jgi:hypothetical protein
MSPPTPQTWQNRRLAYYAALAILFATIVYFGHNYVLWQKFTPLSLADVAAYAQRECLPVLQAARRYQADHGTLPPDIDTLIQKRYLPTAARGFVFLDRRMDQAMYVAHAFYYEEISYTFDVPDEHWEVRGPFVSGRLPLAAVPRLPPTTNATAPATSGAR